MFGPLQQLIVAIISIAAFGGAVWGLVDAVRVPQDAFPAAGKQSKTLWVVLLGVATAVLFTSLPYPLGWGSGPFGFLGLAASVAVIVYFVGVRPAIEPFRRSSGGPRRSNTGGW